MTIAVRVLYQDDDLIACEKPSGLVIHATLDPNRPHFYAAVRAILPPAQAKLLSLHHRLDVQTSGVVLFSVSERMNRPLQEMFQNRKIRKTYVAVTHPPRGNALPNEFVVKNYLVQKGQPGKAVEVKSGGKVAETKFQVVVRGSDFMTVRAEPRTGRTHQIRAHLSQVGLPLIADSLYGGRPAFGLKNFLLHAQALEFIHPLSQQNVLIESAVPIGFRPFLGSKGRG